jgi:hypothetical protein
VTSRVEHSVEVARKLNKSLRLENVAVGGIKAEANSFGEPPFKFAMKLGAVHWTRSDTNLLAFFPVEVDIQDGSVEPLASLSVLMRATHGISDELTDEQIAAVPHYLGIVGWMQVWPYVRSEIQELSTKLGFPPLTLPVLLAGQTRHVPVRSSDEIESDEEGEDSDEELTLSSD